MPHSEIAERFRETCRAGGGRPAILGLATGRTTSFAELYEQYTFVRRALATGGVGEGTPVVSLAGNRAEFVPLLVACLDLGAVLVPVGEATEVEAAAIAQSAGAAVIVSDRGLAAALPGGITLSDDLRVFTIASPRDVPSPGSSLVMKLTSGSTDLPKATLANERNLIGDTANIMAAMGHAPDDINLALIPLSHAYAIGNLVIPLVLHGLTLALRPSFSPSQFVEDVRVSRATIFPGVPFMFAHLQQALGAERLPASLRLLISAGARIEPDTVRWFLEHAGRKIHSFYGSSETGGITYDESDRFEEPAHVGRPLPGVTVDIRPQPDLAEAGRVFVRSAGVAAGYAHGRGDAVSAFQDGGFLTGDLGCFDAGGRLVLTGRVSPLVNVAGRKVDPAEIDRVLLALPGVRDARALGVSSRTRGEELVAFVVRADPSLTPLDIRQQCAGTLSAYKIPRRFLFLDELPVDARGKVDRRALAALAEDRA